LWTALKRPRAGRRITNIVTGISRRLIPQGG
jgi:hypothetical protein